MICEWLNCSSEFWSFWSDVANVVIAVTAVFGAWAVFSQLKAIAK
jgi:hypothetical protein